MSNLSIGAPSAHSKTADSFIEHAKAAHTQSGHVQTQGSRLCRATSVHPQVNSSVAMTLVVALMLAGCQQAPQTTMDLLRAGDARVCTASDVEETLRTLIRSDDAANDAYTISFADASLASFDKVVARATCNTALKVDGPNGVVIERTIIDFVVSPAAQDPSSFVVSSNTGALKNRLSDAISEDETNKATDDARRQASEELAALVKPGWLIGRWVAQSQGSQACTSGPYDDYGRGGRYSDQVGTGRWRLAGQDLTVVVPTASVAFTINDASMDTFTMQDANGDDRTYRRCASDELQSAPAPQTVAPPSELPPSEAPQTEPTGQPTAQ